MNSEKPLFQEPKGEDLTIPFYPNAQLIAGREKLNVRDDFTMEGATQKLMEARETFFFNTDTFEELGLDKYLLANTRFTLREDWSVGRTDSVQGVYFGELTLGIDDGSEVNMPVACKPYRLLERHRAIHEFVGLEYFKHSPKLPSFTPLGFWVDAYGKVTLLTKFEEHVKSLDNVNWEKPGQRSFWEDDELPLALQKAARTLALLHARGLTHRDAKIKNMAVDTQNWGIRLVDLTTLRLIHNNDDPRPEEWRLGVIDDLKTLVNSLRVRGFLAGERKAFKKEVLDVGFLALHASLIHHPSALPFKGADQIVKEVHGEITASIR